MYHNLLEVCKRSDVEEGGGKAEISQLNIIPGINQNRWPGSKKSKAPATFAQTSSSLKTHRTTGEAAALSSNPTYLDLMFA